MGGGMGGIWSGHRVTAIPVEINKSNVVVNLQLAATLMGTTHEYRHTQTALCAQCRMADICGTCRGITMHRPKCTNCRGFGCKPSVKCTNCRGRGTMKVVHSLRLVLNKRQSAFSFDCGDEDETKIAGILTINVTLVPTEVTNGDTKYTVSCDDMRVLYTLQISLRQAMLGGEAKIGNVLLKWVGGAITIGAEKEIAALRKGDAAAWIVYQIFLPVVAAEQRAAAGALIAQLEALGGQK